MHIAYVSVAPPVLQEGTHPVAVYYAAWLPINGILVNLSLVEQCVEGSIDKVHWLRVGVANDEEGEAEEAAAEATTANSGASSNDPSDQNVVVGASDVCDETSKDRSSAVGGSGDSSNAEQGSEDNPGSGGNSSSSSGTGAESDHSPGKMRVLTVLSNEVGRLIHPCESDWVDLCRIDAREYFMANHMQRVLEYIALRVSVSSSVAKGLVQHQFYYAQYVVKAKASNTAAQEAYTDAMYMCDLDAEQIARFTNVVTQAPQIFVHEQPGLPADLGEQGGRLGVDSNHVNGVCFDPYIFQYYQRVKLNRSWNLRFCPCTIRISVSYTNRISQVSAQNVSAATASARTAAATIAAATIGADAGLSHGVGTPNGRKAADGMGRLTPEELQASSRATHINLHVYPFSANASSAGSGGGGGGGEIHRVEEGSSHSSQDQAGSTQGESRSANMDGGENKVLPSCTIRVEIVALQMLLPPRHKKEAPVNFEELLREGDKEALRDVLRRLTALLRLEYTDQGPRYSILGTFSSPVHESRPWPGSQLSAADRMGTTAGSEEEDDALLAPQGRDDATAATAAASCGTNGADGDESGEFNELIDEAVHDWGRQLEDGGSLTFDEEMRMKREQAAAAAAVGVKTGDAGHVGLQTAVTNEPGAATSC